MDQNEPGSGRVRSSVVGNVATIELGNPLVNAEPRRAHRGAQRHPSHPRRPCRCVVFASKRRQEVRPVRARRFGHRMEAFDEMRAAGGPNNATIVEVI